ncbi:hypothetical protein [Novosphingobium taihuense]|uniref:hypothetical protein n=1 Tax=Novosphingobium taihuense TaxID=260085 RepID=UPI0011A1D0B1|nr:hypothetical protein [Novosphingobium taihuense]
MVLGLLLAVLSAPALAQVPPKGLDTKVAEGTVGPYVAGLNITVRDHVSIVAAHYYYAKTGLDIPLKVAVQGDTFLFDEPHGGHFELHLTNADASAPRPLNFYKSTGLAGTWTREGKTLPVVFGFSSGYPGPAPDRWYAAITSESDAQFEGRVRTFLRCVLLSDVDQAARAVSWPLIVNGKQRITIHNRRELAKRWKTLFTPTALRALRKAIPHEMFVRNGMAMVANGAVWFDAGGAKVLNLP